jgi:hypothetical protein
MRKGRKYKFNIINMMKPDSVYNQGLRPLAYSNKEAEARGIGWFRTASVRLASNVPWKIN